MIISALVVAGLIYLLLQHTRFGKAVRAISQDRALAQVSGIPARRIIMQTWALAGAIAGFAGFVLADTIGTFGTDSRLQLPAAHHHGHGGRGPCGLHATFGGAIIVGLAIQIAGTFHTSSAYELVFAFLLLVLLMLFRPNGVFVRRSAVAVRA